jgi:hypothetical protein
MKKVTRILAIIIFLVACYRLCEVLQSGENVFEQHTLKNIRNQNEFQNHSFCKKP